MVLVGLEILAVAVVVCAALLWEPAREVRRWRKRDTMRPGGYMVPQESGDVAARLEMERAAYVAGRIDVEEFERQVERVLSGQMGKPDERRAGARGLWQIPPNRPMSDAERRRLRRADRVMVLGDGDQVLHPWRAKQATPGEARIRSVREWRDA
jgi:hypothetical protein